MSHRITVKVQAKSEAIVLEACAALGYDVKGHGTWNLYGESVNGLGIVVPGIHFPVVWDSVTGEFSFDTWDPRSFRYSSPDGITRLIHECAVRQSVADLSLSGISVLVGDTVLVDDKYITEIEVIK